MSKDVLTPEEYLQKLHSEMDEEAKQSVQQPVIEEQKPEKKGKSRKKRRKKHYFLRFLIVVALLTGSFFALKSPLFYVSKIEVEGNRFYTPAQVIELSGLETGKNMFFEIKTRPARDNLLTTPYIKLAKIERKPLATLVIKLEERLEYAAVPKGSEYVLIDNEGMVLSVTDKQPELPLLEGMIIEEMTEGVPLKVEQSYLLTDTLQLMKNVEQTDLYFYRIYFSSVIVKAYINENYYCEGEPSEISANLEKIKTLISEQYNAGVNKGVIRVGSGGYMAFDPKID